MISSESACLAHARYIKCRQQQLSAIFCLLEDSALQTCQECLILTFVCENGTNSVTKNPWTDLGTTAGQVYGTSQDCKSSNLAFSDCLALSTKYCNRLCFSLPSLPTPFLPQPTCLAARMRIAMRVRRARESPAAHCAASRSLRFKPHPH